MRVTRNMVAGLPFAMIKKVQRALDGTGKISARRFEEITGRDFSQVEQVQDAFEASSGRRRDPARSFTDADLAELRRSVRETTEFFQRELAEAVDDAVKTGKIPHSDRERWLQQGSDKPVFVIRTMWSLPANPARAYSNFWQDPGAETADNDAREAISKKYALDVDDVPSALPAPELSDEDAVARLFEPYLGEEAA